MRDQNSQANTAARSTTGNRSTPENTEPRTGSTSGSAKNAMDSAQRVGSEVASSITGHVKAMLDEKVGDGADVVGHLANSVHTAAEGLDQNAPQLASLVRGVAHQLDGYAMNLRENSVDQLVSAASNYTRRQPAVVFGLAALVGFFALRTIKSIPERNETATKSRLSQAGGFHGS